MTETQDERPESIVSNDWQSTRETVLRRDGRCCQFCGIGESAHEDRYGSSLDVHHIVPRERYGSDSVDNLVTVCSRCHKTAEKISKRAFDTIDRRRKNEQESRSEVQTAAIAHNKLTDLLERHDSEKLSEARDLIYEWFDGRGAGQDE